MKVKKDLEQFLELLKEENRALIKCFSDEKAAKMLNTITEKKEKLLVKILNYTKEDIQPYKDLIIEIDALNQRNKNLAKNGMEFAEEIFSALFPQTEQNYSQNGEIKKKVTTNLINKKV